MEQFNHTGHRNFASQAGKQSALISRSQNASYPQLGVDAHRIASDTDAITPTVRRWSKCCLFS